MRKVKWPMVSVVMPTLNSERTLEKSLFSVVEQDYPAEVEIVVADGGSGDRTVEIARSYGAKVVRNILKTGEAGKACGAKKASGEILAFVDSDNILPERRWLRQMVEPFMKEKEVIATEPLYFTYRREDHWLTRYFALLGMGDPLNLFIGNYDRYSLVSNKWTGLKIEAKNKGNFLLLRLKERMPTIGANGFLIRKETLVKYPIKDYLFDIDVLKFLAEGRPVWVAKVKTGVVHLFSGDVATFVRKQRRRIRDYLYYQRVGVRAKETNKLRFVWGGAKFGIATLVVVPLVVQMVMGYMRKKDVAWLFHPLACWLTLVVYGFEVLRFAFSPQQFDRSRWSQ